MTDPRLSKKEPFLWINDSREKSEVCLDGLELSRHDMEITAKDWERYCGLLSEAFPELKEQKGIIDSPLFPVSNFQKEMRWGTEQGGTCFVKADHLLSVAGSIKARGGIYEVVKHAETLAKSEGLLQEGEDPVQLLKGECQSLFQSHTVTVGSTGNLGMSVGITARALGFQAVVHMSYDAKAWKVKRLTDAGVQVVQHDADYASAVAQARNDSEKDPSTYFIDDERSQDLFLGYSTAAYHLQKQLQEQQVRVDRDHPLFVYLPCGIGGAPGGITFGLKHLFGDNVHCFFAEPVESACALAQLSAVGDETVNVRDFGMDNRTEADGLAVGEMSELVARLMRPLLSGCYTADDESLFGWLSKLKDTEGLKVEPSAAIGCIGPGMVLNTPEGQRYIDENDLQGKLPNATHILWTTGGLFVPEEIFTDFYKRGLKVG